MASPVEIPVAGVSAITEVVSAAAQTEIIGELNLVLALIPDTAHPTAQTTPPSGAAPMYDIWPPALADWMRAELIALRTAIDAAPTS